MTKVKSINRMARMTVNPLLRRVATSVFSMLVGLTGIATSANAAELNIYSHRQQFLLQPFLDAFTAETGITTNVVYASKGLAQRLKAEGEASPADVILTVDIARLSEYSDLDLLSPVDSAVLNAAIPSELRASDNRWFAFSTRARLVVTSKERVAADAISNIEELADPQWEGRVCTRKGSHVYNRSLLASIIAANGKDAAEAWADGLVANWIVVDIPKKNIVFTKSKKRIVKDQQGPNILLERDPAKILNEMGRVQLLVDVENSIISQVQNTYNFVPNVFCSESAHELLVKKNIIE